MQVTQRLGLVEADRPGSLDIGARRGRHRRIGRVRSGHESPEAPSGFEDARRLQLAIRPGHGVDGQAQLAGQLAYRRQDLRFRLARTADRDDMVRLLDQMTSILTDEIARCSDALETARRDSRLGYEWEQDYIYTPDTIAEKLKLLRVTLEQQIPAFRKRNKF